MTTTGFCIDDVRDTLTADVTRFLGRIEASAREILQRHDRGLDAVPGTVPLFQNIGDHGHAIYGTSCLVAAESLSSSAHAIEELALRGRDELARAARHLERARAIAMALLSGSSDMMAILSLELEHRPTEASKIASGWQLRAVETMEAVMSQVSVALAPSPREPAAPLPPPASPLATPVDQGWSFDAECEAGAPPQVTEPVAFAAPPMVAAADDGFSFATSVSDLPADLETGAIDAELAEIFEAEARETLLALADQLAGLAADPGDRKLCRDLERSYHTLKGAAATVGLTSVSERAAELQHRVEARFDSAGAAGAEFIANLVRDTEVLRRMAGLGPSSAASLASGASGIVPRKGAAASQAPAAGDELRAEFEHEARVLLEEAGHLAGGLADAEAEAGAQLADELGRLLHRLRGSALVAGSQAVAEEATRLETTCGARPLDAAALANGVLRCAALLSGPPPRSAHSEAGASTDEVRAVFLSEARTLYREATSLVGRLAATGDEPRTARDGLCRLMHRLKGSALVVSDNAIAREAKALHDALTADAASMALGDGLARLATLLGLDTAGGAGAATSAGSGPRGGHAATGESRQRVPVPAPDPELEPGFQQECSELLESLDRGVLALEDSERPKDQLASVLRVYHTLKGVVNSMGLAPTGQLLHQAEDFVSTLQQTPILPPLRGVVSVLLQVHTEVRRHLKTARSGYIEVSAGRIESRLGRVLMGDSRATGSGPASNTSHPAGRLGEGSEASGASGTGDGPDRKNLRVSIDRLDSLMNLAGELVINRSRLLSRIDALHGLQGDLGRHSKRLIDVVEKFRDDHEFSTMARGRGAVARAGHWGAFSELELDRYEDVNILARSLAESSTDMQEIFGQLGGGLSALVDDSDALGTIIAGIQGEVTHARMVPLGSLFSRLQLPVRDAAQREHRDVKMVTFGDEVHLDKTIVDALFQPMLHLVRNAVSHGLEPAARRTAAGKPATGTIALRARQELGQIVVEVFDDGAGLDLERLHARGVAMELIPADLSLDDPRVRDLVFAPGLSTQASAGAVAGRGVGCDVVRRAIERLNGSIRVDSVHGQRTSFIITLPLTLAITRALLVRHGGQTFAVPLYFTDRIVDVQDHQIVESAGQRRLEIDGAFVPIRRMTEFLVGTAATSSTGPVLLLRIGDQRLNLQVDAVVGQEEVVVKGLGALLTGHPMFAGVTIRGTGEIVLIFDVPSLVETIARADAPRRAVRRPAARHGVEPAADAAPAPAPAPGSEPPVVGVESEPGGALRVLFVDDSVSVRKVAERALKALGVSVTLAADGIDALEKLHAQPFDVVFTDLEMPRMHGYELIRELRFLPAYSALPVIVVTSRSGKKHREEAHALGATHYMTKPFSPQSLEAALIRFGGPRARGLGVELAEGGAISEAIP